MKKSKKPKSITIKRTKMITRKDYMEDPERSHRAYYAQFVTPGIKATVRRWIGVDRLMASKDPHLNDIPLREWDALIFPKDARNLLKKAGDFYSDAGKVCVLKEAARQLIEENK